MIAYMQDFSSCSKCNYETSDAITTCPHCGKPLQSSIVVRRLGWLLVGGGGSLTIFMIAAIILVNYMVGRQRPFGTSLRFNGSPKDAMFLCGVLGLVAAIGLTATAGGVWQIRYGKTNRKIKSVGFALVMILLGVAAFVSE